ncbi:hypothetical protein SLINC_6377 [Streptomyces lincolnensis]|uniref:Uncharacterized protein n=1 Tax=Streptomyces lincolnensis TaxID=1915 RepID=A0A1B1MJ16_STRLN|nr:hypothetical protein [Streptomyces lincolnensis]ANS68601.1 hypothetical protein SLINC_6377 [Streptomyces lincolnensis]AXG53193.1 hypothetical protein SLCG_2038 [Streptomyces lincolnensis]QMV10220.1 hypothetical protein GJU35_34235 [Streptomyces lincolnensis]
MSTATAVTARLGCVADGSGRILFDLPAESAQAAEGQRLVLRLRPKKGEPEKVLHTLALEPGDDGRLYAALDPETVLAEGRWDVYLLGAGSERQRLRPGLRDLRALVDGHLRDRRTPLAVRIPYATVDGYFAIRAWLRPAHAEVERVDVSDGSTTVGARLHGDSLAAGATVRLRLRGGGGTVRDLKPLASDDGHGFFFTVDHDALAAARHGVWDIFVQPSPDAPLVRLARLLDDVADRKEVFVYPAVTVDGACLRPYFTVDNDLSLEVRRAV